MKALEELKDLGLQLRESDSPDRQKVDFAIEDDEDNVAWVWGDSLNDVDWECNHPYQCIEWDTDDDSAPTGQCLLCGSYCSGHYETDIGNVEDYYWSSKETHPTEWYPRHNVGGLVGEYLKELRAGNA